MFFSGSLLGETLVRCVEDGALMNSHPLHHSRLLREHSSFHHPVLHSTSTPLFGAVSHFWALSMGTVLQTAAMFFDSLITAPICLSFPAYISLVVGFFLDGGTALEGHEVQANNRSSFGDGPWGSELQGDMVEHHIALLPFKDLVFECQHGSAGARDQDSV